MKRSVLNLLGGLLLCLPMLFTSCSEKDNSLEQIVNQPNLEGLQKALYKNAEVTIEYKVYKNGQSVAKTVTIKNVGTVEEPKYEVQGEMPTDLGYKLTCDMGYIDGNLYFGLLYNELDPNASEDDDETDDLFDLSPVMVVKFDTKTSKYDVYALPGFDFDVISINGAGIDVTRASDKKATINFYHDVSGTPTAVTGLSDCPMTINLNGVSKWEDLDEAYNEVGLGVFAPITDNDGDGDNEEADDMVIDLSDYPFYFEDASDADYWKVFVIYNETFDAVQEKSNVVENGVTYSAKDNEDHIYIPCYGLNSNNRIALVDMLTLETPAAGTTTWRDIVALGSNSDYIKIAYSTATKPTIVGADGKIGTNGGYYGLYDNSNNNARVNADTEYSVNDFRTKDFHLYELRDQFKTSDKGFTEARDHSAEFNLRW